MIRAVLQENLSFGLPTRSDANWAVQLQKMVRDMKFLIKKVEGVYYLNVHVHVCCENKGADQLHNYCAADLRLCFRI